MARTGSIAQGLPVLLPSFILLTYLSQLRVHLYTPSDSFPALPMEILKLLKDHKFLQKALSLSLNAAWPEHLMWRIFISIL